ncbi:hypothetical protein GCM10018784_79970 [Streptomyces hydrogenans]|nr:hypothetical protein GCM10018784_79970 [Streptomyces hydrogenans]
MRKNEQGPGSRFSTGDLGLRRATYWWARTVSNRRHLLCKAGGKHGGKRNRCGDGEPVTTRAPSPSRGAVRRVCSGEEWSGRLHQYEQLQTQGGPVFRDGDALVNRCQFVEDHQRRHGVKRLCDIL